MLPCLGPWTATPGMRRPLPILQPIILDSTAPLLQPSPNIVMHRTTASAFPQHSNAQIHMACGAHGPPSARAEHACACETQVRQKVRQLRVGCRSRPLSCSSTWVAFTPTELCLWGECEPCTTWKDAYSNQNVSPPLGPFLAHARAQARPNSFCAVTATYFVGVSEATETVP